MARKVYQFHVSLIGPRPKIWRRIQVPSTYSFWDLHVAVQDAMGWLDYHLHAFDIPHPDGGPAARIGIPDECGFEEDPPVLPGWQVPISGYFAPGNPAAEYTYDFGDDWRHAVVLEDILPRVTGVRYPLCVAGEMRCPPEDVGGPRGYREFLEAISDRRHPEHESYLEWVGGAYDPRAFDPARVRFDSPNRRWKKAFTEPDR